MKPKYEAINKRDFLKALRGTYGILGKIAINLKCSRQQVQQLLAKPDWEDVRLAHEDERDKVVDIAEDSVRECAMQQLDLSVASQTSRWLLSHKKRQEYGEQSTVTVEGGKNPIRTEAKIDLESLDLDVDTKRALLAAIKAKEEKAKKELEDKR